MLSTRVQEIPKDMNEAPAHMVQLFTAFSPLFLQYKLSGEELSPVTGIKDDSRGCQGALIQDFCRILTFCLFFILFSAAFGDRVHHSFKPKADPLVRSGPCSVPCVQPHFNLVWH